MLLPSIELAELADKVALLLCHCTEEEADTVVRVALGKIRKEKLCLRILGPGDGPRREPDDG